MLSFTLNNEPFALDTSVSVRLTWRNPACNFADFPGDVGLGIEIPVNDFNRSLLGNPERFERYAPGNKREFSRFEVRYGGALLMGGTLVVTSASHEHYECWLRSDLGNLGKMHREKNITESYSFTKDRHFENKTAYDPEEDDYACPRIFNTKFFDEKGEETEVEIKVGNPNFMQWVRGGWGTLKIDEREFIKEKKIFEDLTYAFQRTALYFVNQKDDSGRVLTPDSLSFAEAPKIASELDVAVVSPMLFLNSILRYIAKDAGFAIEENFLADDPDLKNLILYNNYDITTITLSRSLYGFLAYRREHSPWYDIAQGYPVETMRRHIFRAFQYKDLIPSIQIKDFLLSIQNLLNVFFHFRPGRKIIDIHDREAIFEETAINVEEYLTGFWLMGEEQNLTLKFTFEHDSNDLMFSEYWTDIDKYRTTEKEPVLTYESLNYVSAPEIDEIRYVVENKAYYQYKLWIREGLNPETGENEQKKYLGWQIISDGWQNGFINRGRDEEEEIATKFSTLKNPAGASYAQAMQKGNIRSDVFTFEKFTPRLLFYDGAGNATYEGADISLDWGIPLGNLPGIDHETERKWLLNSRWDKWSRFWSRRQPVEAEAHFPLSMLAHVVENIYRKFRTREGEFMIEELETEFGLHEISTTKIKGYKMNYSPREYRIGDNLQLDDFIVPDQYINMLEWDLSGLLADLTRLQEILSK